MAVWSQFLRYLISLPFSSQDYVRRICLPHSLLPWTGSSIHRLNLSSCVTPSLKRSPAVSEFQPIVHHLRLYGLGLGPDLPWADEPSPGNLRLSADKILTCLFAYSYRHSHFCTLQYSLRYTFAAYRTLPYPESEITAILEPVLEPSDLSESFYRLVSRCFRK